MTARGGDCEGWELDGDFNAAGVHDQHGANPDRLPRHRPHSQSPLFAYPDRHKACLDRQRLIFVWALDDVNWCLPQLHSSFRVARSRGRVSISNSRVTFLIELGGSLAAILRA